MFLKLILLIPLVYFVNQSFGCNCVSFEECESVTWTFGYEECGDEMVCCPGPTVPPAPITPSERACLEYSNDRTFCPDHPLISHSEKSSQNEFQYMASIGRKYGANATEWMCGGTIIHRKYVLTAAHCLQFERDQGTKEPDIIVRLGAHNASDGIQYKVLNETFHPDRNISKNTIDIAILELNDSVIFNDKIKPACLPTSYVKIGDYLTMCGWGEPEENIKYARQLMKTSIRILNYDNCTAGQKDMHMCGVGVNDSNACKGDSGGPVARWHPTWGSCLGEVHGVVSAGDNCHSEKSHNLYTNILTYLTWIEKTVWPTNEEA